MARHGSYGNDEIMFIGDSNTYSGFLTNGTAGYDPAIDVQHARVLENRIRIGPGIHSYTNVLQDPLACFFPTTVANMGAIGASLTFCRDYYVPNLLAPNRNVRVTATAAGGTTLTSGGATWGAPGGVAGANLAIAVPNVNASIAQDARNAIKLVVVSLGTNDGIAGGITQSGFTAAAQDQATYIRAHVTGATNVPIIYVGMVPLWVSTTPGAAGVAAALVNMPSNISKCGYADTTGCLGQTATNYHFTAAAQRLIGAAIYAGYLARSS